MIYMAISRAAFIIGSLSLEWHAVMVILAVVFLVRWNACFEKREFSRLAKPAGEWRRNAEKGQSAETF